MGACSLNILAFCDLQSGLRPNQVDYLNAHATSTPLGEHIATYRKFAF